MLFALHCRYHACWCTSDFRSQCIKGHGLVPQSRNIPYPASEELRMFNDRLISVIWISIPAKMALILKQDPASKNISKPPSATIFPMLVDMGRQLSGSPRTNSTHTGPINIANGVELIVYLEDWLKCTHFAQFLFLKTFLGCNIPGKLNIPLWLQHWSQCGFIVLTTPEALWVINLTYLHHLCIYLFVKWFVNFCEK